jgi:hypothetical protein
VGNYKNGIFLSKKMVPKTKNNDLKPHGYGQMQKIWVLRGCATEHFFSQDDGLGFCGFERFSHGMVLTRVQDDPSGVPRLRQVS